MNIPNCPHCGTQMKNLFLVNSFFCPNEEKHQESNVVDQEKKNSVFVYYPRNKKSSVQEALAQSLRLGVTPSNPLSPGPTTRAGRSVWFWKCRQNVDDYEIEIYGKRVIREFHGVLDARSGNQDIVLVAPNSLVLSSNHPKFEPFGE